MFDEEEEKSKYIIEIERTVDIPEVDYKEKTPSWTEDEEEEEIKNNENEEEKNQNENNQVQNIQMILNIYLIHIKNFLLIKIILIKCLQFFLSIY